MAFVKMSGLKEFRMISLDFKRVNLQVIDELTAVRVDPKKRRSGRM